MFLNTNDRYSLQTDKALCIYDLSCSGHRSSQLSTEWPGASAVRVSDLCSRPTGVSAQLTISKTLHPPCLRRLGVHSSQLSVNFIQLSTVTRCPCVRGWDWGVTGSSDELWVTAGAWTLAPDTGLESHEPGQTSDPACDQLPDIWHGHQAQVPGVH